ncbi:MAG: sulfonate ABC transporter substrate-binding protein [Capsulimonadaceae bacterium]|nr:sulfonate ABC transporter substrate-binding protein [Capsulimonadaceae bacterium]
MNINTSLRFCGVLLATTVALGALFGCSRRAGQFASSGDQHVVNIGYQAFGTFRILKSSGKLEEALRPLGYTVVWRQFQAGPPLIEALNAGKIDIGHVGEPPPLIAQASGVPFVYVGMEGPSPQALAILVPKTSSIRTLAGLKGKSVAIVKGTTSHCLLISALKEAGLTTDDVHIKYLEPPDARAAFEQGSIDAWVIWDPYYTSVLRDGRARVLQDGTGLMADREFYIGQTDFVREHPEVVKVVLRQLRDADTYIASHKLAVAKLMSPDLGIDVPTLEVVISHRTFGEGPVTSSAVARQQELADMFHRIALLPKSITVKDAVYDFSTPSHSISPLPAKQ